MRWQDKGERDLVPSYQYACGALRVPALGASIEGRPLFWNKVHDYSARMSVASSFCSCPLQVVSVFRGSGGEPAGMGGIEGDAGTRGELINTAVDLAARLSMHALVTEILQNLLFYYYGRSIYSILSPCASLSFPELPLSIQLISGTRRNCQYLQFVPSFFHLGLSCLYYISSHVLEVGWGTAMVVSVLGGGRSACPEAERSISAIAFQIWKLPTAKFLRAFQSSKQMIDD